MALGVGEGIGGAGAGGSSGSTGAGGSGKDFSCLDSIDSNIIGSSLVPTEDDFEITLGSLKTLLGKPFGNANDL